MITSAEFYGLVGFRINIIISRILTIRYRHGWKIFASLVHGEYLVSLVAGLITVSVPLFVSKHLLQLSNRKKYEAFPF